MILPFDLFSGLLPLYIGRDASMVCSAAIATLLRRRAETLGDRA